MEKNEKLSVENKKKSVTDDDSKINYGGWKVMPYIVGNETFENLGAIGTLANLLVYLTSVFNLNSITATNIINIFNGSANLATLLGAFLSDTYFGRYITLGFCIVASFLSNILFSPNLQEHLRNSPLHTKTLNTGDYKQLRPSQELVAKDLHGVEWKFRHIYIGQPRRHLLTTGWSIFVSRKNLVSRDDVLFLRGENGELRLGIRRVVRPINGLPESVVGNQNCYPNFLSYVANAIFTKSMFHVFYSPRASQPDFIVPYKKYVKSIKNEVIIGTRFKMRFQMDESPERRCNNGMVIGMSDLDPYRWPKSKWRCLMVRWDENIETNHQDRVSPWEIDPSASLPQLSIQSSPRLKKLRTGQQATSPSHLFTEKVVVIATPKESSEQWRSA